MRQDEAATTTDRAAIDKALEKFQIPKGVSFECEASMDFTCKSVPVTAEKLEEKCNTKEGQSPR